MAAGLPEKVIAGLRRMTLYPNRLGEAGECAELVTHIVGNRYLNATTLSIDAGTRMV
jgi:hypothetical protein